MGPTAAGKTDIAIAFSEQYPCDIISVDSAMIYRGMNIGTAKPDASIQAIVSHKLIDIRDPSESYSAAEFCIDATREIELSLSKGRIPLLVGGTMLYFKALQEGLSTLPSSDPVIRAQLEVELQHEGVQALHTRLALIDPIAAEKIKATDTQRVQRALEVYEITGIPISTWQQETPEKSPYHFVNIGVIPNDRAVLHDAIAKRFKQMLDLGFIEEVESLRARGDLNLSMPSMRAVGYRQVWEYLDGQFTQESMFEKGIVATRQLAKRQMTWLRSWNNLHTYNSLNNMFGIFRNRC